MLKLFFSLLLLVSQTVGLSPVTVGNLTLKENRWIRPSTGPNTAAYLTITNSVDQPDKLIRVDSDDAVTVELHNHINDNGVMRMRPVDAIEIGKDPVEMKPGGLHIMLMSLKDSFQGKDSVPLTLHFEKAGPVTVEFPVQIQSNN